eukprot:CAMPEP_0206213296 /NCGR_PEP_ID=MMETSP0047_2-20121206/1045_1 /ASSEMBLY_ACC=CAM_ASM_000192 /TAXON_ID=195065 /ORGANISM="Chroomonas mesostigmatica_cf, Strain CCMP1168" /LENGTH=135 /DNA_ID=CAMNT_0053635433 /DNA_START=61 /DNA_END=465 /DNA_ORIENTATION=+
MPTPAREEQRGAPLAGLVVDPLGRDRLEDHGREVDAAAEGGEVQWRAPLPVSRRHISLVRQQQPYKVSVLHHDSHVEGLRAVLLAGLGYARGLALELCAHDLERALRGRVVDGLEDGGVALRHAAREQLAHHVQH